MAVELIRYAALAPTPWRNGAGRKADIAAGPGWMVAFAWLDRDAPFSDYAGHDRTITLLTGPGFSLHFPDGGDDAVVDMAGRPYGFDGGRAASCRIAGPCFVLNVMTARPVRHRVVIAAGPAKIGDGFAVWLSDSPATAPDNAGMFDTLHLTGDAMLDLPAGASAAMIHISPS